jgi:hypothetical protein
MYFSEQDFQRAVVKMARQTGDDEDQIISGQQSDAVPEMLQPDKGPGEGPRGEHEALTTGAEQSSQDAKAGQLKDAFSGFDSASRQTGAELRELLDSYGRESISSKAQAEQGATKLSSARLGAFADEVAKIAKKVPSKYGRKAALRLMAKMRGRQLEALERGGASVPARARAYRRAAVAAKKSGSEYLAPSLGID